MKKIFLILIFFTLIGLPAFSDDFFDNYAGSEDQGNLWDNQKPVTDAEFEKAIETLQAGKKKKEEKQRKRRIKKISGGGTSLHPGLDPTSEIQAQEPLKVDKDEGRLINIPVDTFLDDKILEKGFYNVYGEKEKDGTIYLSFYQSQYLKGKIKAYETSYDSDSDTIDFVKYEPYNDSYIRIIFGSLDFNAYTYLMCVPENLSD
ncbi:hypothetical protein IJ750_05565 [bacterium]|nr:hypothetical protein [bacterium]MBR1776521.1 hypothetical protein [bacterium]